MAGRPHREDAFLGAALLLVPPCPADGGVGAEAVENLPQRHRLHRMGVEAGAVADGRYPGREPLMVGVDDEIEAERSRLRVAEGDHLPEFPGGVDMHDLEGDGAGVKGLARQVQQNRGIFSDGIEQDRPVEHGLGLAQDVDGLGLQHALAGAQQRAIGLISYLTIQGDFRGHRS